MGQNRDIRGALYGSRLITLPHVQPEVEACQRFLEGAAPALVEVGFDHGRRLLATARENPGWRVLGLEVRAKRVVQAKERASGASLSNLLVWRMDARTVFAGVLADASVDVVEVFFPTPWWNPSLRQKRLLIDPGFISDVGRVLRPGGVLHVATDVVDYAEHILEVLSGSDRLMPIQEGAGDQLRPGCSEQSRREWKCQREGIAWRRWYWQRVSPDPL